MDFSIPEDVLNGMNPETTGSSRGKTYKADERFFRPKLTADNDNTYQAKIRFLYKPGSKEVFKTVYRHYFEDMLPGLDGEKPKQWTTSGVCRKTLKENCPCCQSFFASKNLADKGDPLMVHRHEKFFKKRNSTTKYLVNILVIDDKNTPANNGKVFLWEATPFVYKIVQEAMHGPQKKAVIKDAFADDDEESGEVPTIRNPFHPTEGCDFLLRVCKDDKGWTSYANSSFRKNKMGEFVRTAIAEDDDSINAIISQAHNLEEAITVLSAEEWTKKIEDIDAKLFTQDTVRGAYVSPNASEGPDFSAPASHQRRASQDDEFFAAPTKSAPPAKTEAEDDGFGALPSDDDFADPFAPTKGKSKASASFEDELPF